MFVYLSNIADMSLCLHLKKNIFEPVSAILRAKSLFTFPIAVTIETPTANYQKPKTKLNNPVLQPSNVYRRTFLIVFLFNALFSSSSYDNGRICPIPR